MIIQKVIIIVIGSVMFFLVKKNRDEQTGADRQMNEEGSDSAL